MTKRTYYPLRKGFNDLLGRYTDRPPLYTTFKVGSTNHDVLGRMDQETEFRVAAAINKQANMNE